MKGFPNQVADLQKLAIAMREIVRLEGQQARDDGILGEALVRARVAGPGHGHQPIEDYIRAQRLKEPQNQSPRATARLLRELFKILGFVDELENSVRVTQPGHRAAAFARSPVNQEQITFWRRAIRDMSHDGGDGRDSHPYQALLRLIAKRPGIKKEKLALALEAADDSPQELDRILSLADLPADKIRQRIVVSRSGGPVTATTWANAVKVLPHFAEQLGDVIVSGPRGRTRYQIADAPGRESAGAAIGAVARPPRRGAPRAPRTARSVTPQTIGQAGTVETFDETDVRTLADPVATARARHGRLQRHNLMVRELAARLAAAHIQLYEDPFDILGIIEEIGLMVEAKTLDGTVDDERARVREALSQLLYYPAFLVSPVVSEDAIKKIACFERRPSNAHIRWLNDHGIAVIWKEGNGFAGDALASRFLGRFLEEFSRGVRDA
jgi:hypothetical protein